MAQNGLTRRVEALERLAGPADDPYLHAEGWESINRLANLADRLRGAPEKPAWAQSAAERVVRTGLAAAEGHKDADYARRFWRAVSECLRARDRGDAA